MESEKRKRNPKWAFSFSLYRIFTHVGIQYPACYPASRSQSIENSEISSRYKCPQYSWKPLSDLFSNASV